MRPYLLNTAAMALCLTVCAPAFAQSTATTTNTNTTDTTTTGKRSSQLQEVVVTAQRRQENIQKTAIPLTAITGAELKAQNKTELDQVLRDVPSVQIQAAPQGADIVIRGVGGNDVGGIQQDPDVSVMEDSVYSGQAASVLGSVYDTQRIEVLRGPQGTLYGRNAAGGAVNILTNDPSQKFGVGMKVGYGNLDLRHLDGYLNLPVNDLLAVRVAGDIDARHGYYSNGGGQIQNSGLRAKVKYAPNDDISIVGRVDYWKQGGLTETTVANPAAATASSCGGPPCAIFAPANPSNPWDTSVAAGSPFVSTPVWNNNTFYTYSAQLDWNLGFATMTLIPSMTDSTQIQSSASLFAPSSFPLSTSTTTEKQYTGEARFSSPKGSAFTWVGGVYVLRNDANQSGTTAGGSGPAYYAQQSNNKRPAASVGGFAQGTYPVLNSLRVTLGGRYNVDSKSVLYGICSSTNGVTCDGIYTSPATNINANYSSFTYRAGVEYDLTPTAMLYSNVASGYKAGGFSTAYFPPSSYQPESLVDYEIGLKSRWLDNRLQFNADAYIYQYHNQQIELHVYPSPDSIFPAQYQYLVPSDATAQLGILDVNAGNSRYMGVEEQAKFQVTDSDQISFDVAYEQARYGHFVIDTTGAPPGGAYTQQYYDLTNKQEANTPKWTGSVGYQHVWDLFDGNLTFHSSTHFQTSDYNTIQEWFANGHTKQAGYHQTDLYLNYASGSDKWHLGLWVKNLENNAIVTSVYPLWKETLAEPRTYGMTASFDY